MDPVEEYAIRKMFLTYYACRVCEMVSFKGLEGKEKGWRLEPMEIGETSLAVGATEQDDDQKGEQSK